MVTLSYAGFDRDRMRAKIFDQRSRRDGQGPRDSHRDSGPRGGAPSSDASSSASAAPKTDAPKPTSGE